MNHSLLTAHCHMYVCLIRFFRLRMQRLFRCQTTIITTSFPPFFCTRRVMSSVSIIKSASDDRAYRVVSLPNELSVLLVSDPTTDKASAAMDVNVGHLSDPDDIPGLAHFCEHMLFLGTEKYPDEKSYKSFLSAHGGRSNAYTSTENTNYYFDIQVCLTLSSCLHPCVLSCN